ncbi:heterokaryon incompatibility protein-domain-containing protein [Hypoxylon sp. NC1633]|nr:heterokaryon incompatibility protein-domain-containing protein [Hypoxylon sp. NC1633]
MAETCPKSPNQRPYYNYPVLPPGWIRLLRIRDPSHDVVAGFDGFSEEEIQIELYDYPLSSCPDFTSLSYTWGEPTPIHDPLYGIFTKEPRCFPIQINDSILRATRNLRNMLRRLRQIQHAGKHSPTTWIRFFWIDALCVDQDDLGERSAQVALMSSIYKRANSCTVWLGEMDEHAATAINITKEWYAHRAEGQTVFKIASSKSFNKWMFALSKKSVKALLALLSRTWFSRVWVIQEVLLTRSVAGLCGSVLFRFEELLALGSMLSVNGHIHDALPTILSRQGDDQLGLVKLMMKNLRNIISLTAVMLRLGRGSGYPNFEKAIAMTKNCESTDPRDRIYGILSIVAEFQSQSGTPRIDIDYTLSTETVYIKTTAAVASGRNSLGFLEFCYPRQLKDLQGLPSWCPDYNSSNLQLLRVQTNSTNSFAGIIWPGQPSVDVLGNSLLEVDGFRYDVVTQTCFWEDFEDEPDMKIRYVTKLLKMAAGLELRDRSCARRNYTSSVELLWRVFLMDEFDGHRPASPVAGLFFPMILAWKMLEKDTSFVCGITLRAMKLMKDTSSIAGTDSLVMNLEQILKVREALEELCEVIADLHLETGCMLFLPSFAHFQNAIEELKSMEQVNDSHISSRVFFDKLFRAEKAALRNRAVDAGLTTEFDEILKDGFPDTFLHGDELIRSKIFPLFASTSNIMNSFLLFKTQNHVHIGLGYETTIRGDEVWVLHGLNNPVILRPLDNGNYEYCGVAHIQGSMDGDREYWRSMTERVTIE